MNKEIKRNEDRKREQKWKRRTMIVAMELRFVKRANIEKSGRTGKKEKAERSTKT